ncbi:MAG: alanine dehydrogenase [Bacteroidales bacterium]|nr:alanine dehydrogenase [Bacteroidales bacterium]
MENSNLFGESHMNHLMPQEEMLRVAEGRKNLSIGVPKETSFEENRIALAPEAVSLLTQNGHIVLVESQAGNNARFSDSEYAEAGADIKYVKSDVFKADIILKVAPLTTEEFELLKPRQTIISVLNYQVQNEEYFKKLASKKITALAYEFIKDRAGTLPLVRSMSEIAGNASVLIAAEYLGDTKFGKGLLLGGLSGITPTEVVILGAGTVGEYAARVALGFGALVKVFDNSIYRLRRLQNNLNTRIFTSIIQPKVLSKSLKRAHVVIGAIHAPEGITPCVVSEALVKEMKPGAIIVDVSIDRGGCFETSRITTHSNPVFVKHGITHYCVPNIPSRVPQTASYALSNFFAPTLLCISDHGGIENLLKYDYGLRQGVYMYAGILTNRFVGQYFKMPHQDLELLMAAFH